ncbi:MAG: hypothetical protein PHY94_00035 [Candidatus Omnitrophica bacterium]|nr:hypothetical protein [Candidatus Omnitrophota bacterium]
MLHPAVHLVVVIVFQFAVQCRWDALPLLIVETSMKKNWQKPKLTILVRDLSGAKGETVLVTCKMLGGSWNGPFLQVQLCYNQVICEYRACRPGQVQNYCGEGFCSNLSAS